MNMKRKKVLAILIVLTAFVFLASLCGQGPAQAAEGKAGKEPKGKFSYAPSRYHVLPQGDRPAYRGWCETDNHKLPRGGDELWERKKFWQYWLC